MGAGAGRAERRAGRGCSRMVAGSIEVLTSESSPAQATLHCWLLGGPCVRSRPVPVGLTNG